MKSYNWYNAQFPESMWPCTIEPDDYEAKCIRGHNRMSQCTAIIGGLARNIESQIIKTIPRLENMGNMFRDYRIVIFTNDNEDSTGDILKGWAGKNNKITVIEENLNRPHFEQTLEMDRAVAMADYRNRLKSYIDPLPSDYVIIVDLDLNGYSYNGLANSFGWNDWGVISSNGIIYKGKDNHRLFYDAWAFRHFGRELIHPFEEINLLRFNRGETLLEVFSCFNGLAVYKKDVYALGTYSGVGIDGKPDCDHVALHRDIRHAGYKVYMNPSMITLFSQPATF